MAVKLLVLGLPGSGKSGTARSIATSARDKGRKATRYLTLWGTNETANMCWRLEMGKTSRPPLAGERYWLPFPWKGGYMPTSQSGDSSDITTSVDLKPENQNLQGVLDPSVGSRTSNSLHSAQPKQPAERSSIEQTRLSLLRTNNALCIILIIGLILASTVAFCITRSLFSFGVLSFLSLVPSFRRRLEESAFPISQEDLQIRLKELDVEIERIKKQSTVASLALFSWLRRVLSKNSK